MKDIFIMIALSTFVVIILCSCDSSEEFESPIIQIENLKSINTLNYDLAIDKNDNKWIATSTGLIKYGLNTEYFYKMDGLASDTVYEVLADSFNNIWCRHPNDMISQYNGNKFIIHEPSTRSIPKMTDPTALMVDSRNHLWIGARYGLYEFDGISWKNYFYPKAATNLWARRLFPDPENEGSILILTYNREVIRFNGTSYLQLDNLFGIESNKIDCIAKDQRGAIYCGIAAKGLLIRTRGTNSVTSIGEEIEDNIITDIAGGHNGCIWLATDNGLACYENSKPFKFKFAPRDASNIETLELDSKGKPWFTSYFGVLTLK